MNKLPYIFAVSCAVMTLGAAEPKRDIAVVRSYIRNTVGESVLKEISAKEGGKAFLKRFFADQEWMEQFAGSGTWSIKPWKGISEDNVLAGKALAALDLLVWNDEDDFISTKRGRNIATALALSHGGDFGPEKIVRIMELYREWANDGTLLPVTRKYDVRQWREVIGFGQNAELTVESLDWIHDFAHLPPERYGGLCWACHYRLFNCFGASVHGPEYYMPWAHRMNTQELRFRVGGVCGGLSKFGSHGAEAHGLRSFTAGQPGHCAYLVWNEPESRWNGAYFVTGHTSPHNSLGGQGFTALEEQDRYYSHPRRMDAEYLRWKGEWEKSMRTVNGNWCAAVSWFLHLKGKASSETEWNAWAKAVRDTFSDAPAQGWQLYIPYLQTLNLRNKKLAAALLALGAMKENPAKTAERPYWSEIALGPLDKMFKGDDEAMWKIFEAALNGQASTPSFYRQTVAWGADRLMKDNESAKRFLSVVAKNAEKTGAKLDYGAMMLKASKAGDVQMFHQVCSIMRRLAPDEMAKSRPKAWPSSDYGGTLLSPDGALKTSSTSQWERPANYPLALTANDFNAGNAFHTGGEEAPWGMVILPGLSEINGVTIVNVPGQNCGRQVPLKIWVSEDGTDFKEMMTLTNVRDEWKCRFDTPVKAKFVKVGRTPGAKKDVFHLRKILVYGKKLY